MQEQSAKSDQLFLYVDLPRFDWPVVFSEPVRRSPDAPLTMQEYPPPILAARRTVAAGAVQPAAASPFGPTTAALQ